MKNVMKVEVNGSIENKLSPGWNWIKLGFLCEITWGNTSITKRSYTPHGYTAYSAAGPDGYLSTYEYDRSAIVLSAIGAQCGKCFLATGKWTAIKNTIVIYPKKDQSNCDIEYLYFYLNKKEIWPIDAMAQPFITMGGAQKVSIPMPNIHEQKRIVAILREKMSAIEKAKAATKAQLEAASNLFVSYITKIFNSPGALKWPKKGIGDLCEVGTGGTPSTNHHEYYVNGSINWLKSGDVKGNRIFDVPNKITELGLNNSNARLHPIGSVMLAMSGQGKTRGTSAILMVPSACSQSIAAILPSKDILPEFIHLWFMYKYGEIRRLTGDNERTGLNLKIIRSIEIPLPPEKEQEQFANLLNVKYKEIEKMQETLNNQLGLINKFSSLLLRQAFNGEL